MQTYDTVTEALDDLRRQGFTRDYNLHTNHLKCQQDGVELPPDQFEILNVFRFEGMTDPGDETIIYALEEKNGQRGTLVNAYGPYSDDMSAEMVQKLHVHNG
ncbi:hypothetical protein [Fibrisoma limi]|nr:hypothetical protein [Fibrisoma limi]